VVNGQAFESVTDWLGPVLKHGGGMKGEGGKALRRKADAGRKKRREGISSSVSLLTG